MSNSSAIPKSVSLITPSVVIRTFAGLISRSKMSVRQIVTYGLYYECGDVAVQLLIDERNLKELDITRLNL
jgi:hypothetical protein